MIKARAVGKSSFRGVVRHPGKPIYDENGEPVLGADGIHLHTLGEIKRDYGVIARTHPNRLINWAYRQFYRIKRRVQDLHYNATH